MVLAISDAQEKRLVEVARLFYEEQLSKSEIAQLHQISITHVNRLLKDARQKGIVEVVIRAPRFEDLEARLARVYGLRNAHIVPHMDDANALRAELADAGAEALQPRLTKGMKVGVASGSTIFETVSRVKDSPSEIEIYPLNVLANRETEIKSLSANAIATILWFKCRPLAKAYRFEMFFPHRSISEIREAVKAYLVQAETEKLRYEICDLDVYVLGISGLRADSQLVELSKELGTDFKGLWDRGVVGDIAFNTISPDGAVVETELDQFIFHIELDALQSLSKRRDRTVLLIGGGTDKCAAIRGALKGRIFNEIVTDNETAKALLSESDTNASRGITHV